MSRFNKVQTKLSIPRSELALSKIHVYTAAPYEMLSVTLALKRRHKRDTIKQLHLFVSITN
jgi:hypothetical protein